MNLLSALLLSGSALLPAASAQTAPAPAGQLHVLLINGGSRAGSNYASHLQHMKEMYRVMEARGVPPERITVFNADGGAPGADMLSLDVPEEAWLASGTGLDGLFAPSQVDSVWEGVEMLPAKEARIGEWFRRSGRKLAPGDRLWIFTTDHGTEEGLDLWGERLAPDTLRGMLAGLPDGVQATLMMSQCHSGTFLDGLPLEGEDAAPAGDVCGIYSVPRDMIAFGCYASSRIGRIGFASRWIDAMQTAETPAAALAEVQRTDDSPDVPLASSDLYLRRLLEQEAAARRISLLTLTDDLIRQSRLERQYLPVNTLISHFHAGSADLSRLQSGQEEMDALARRYRQEGSGWTPLLYGLNRENFDDLRAADPQWDRLPDPGSPEILQPLVDALRARAASSGRWPWLQGIAARMDALKWLSWEGSAWRAIFLRQQWSMQRSAGEELLKDPRFRRESEIYAGLNRCEQAPVGLAPAPRAVHPGPPALRLSPPDEVRRQQTGASSFGVFVAASDGALLLRRVNPGSAARAGLKAGDRITAINGAPPPSAAQFTAMEALAPPGVPWKLEVGRGAERFLLLVAPE